MRPSLRWHECIASLKQTPDLPQNSWVFQKGNRVHERIEADFGTLKIENDFLYADPELPFDIGYRPDLYDEKAGVVYEIKPVKFYRENTDYCVAQLSGYCHFRKASGAFIIYTNDGYSGLMPPYLKPWSELKEIALKQWGR